MLRSHVPQAPAPAHTHAHCPRATTAVVTVCTDAATTTSLSAPVETSKDADDIAFEEISSYLDGLEPQLVNVQKHVATLVKKRKGGSRWRGGCIVL